MPSSRPDKSSSKKAPLAAEPHNFNQLGLDFLKSTQYTSPPRKETESMNPELIEQLEQKIGDIVEKYTRLKEENARLAEENQQLQSDREGFKSRVDSILNRLDGI